jgi:hypothetical protein
MAALDLSPPPSLIPVIIISEKADVLKIIYITTSIESDHKSGKTFMQELKSHLPSRKLTRLGRKCRLKHWIVSRTTLIAVSTYLNPGSAYLLTFPIRQITAQNSPHRSKTLS